MLSVGSYLGILLYGLFCCALGYIMANHQYEQKSIGDLRIDSSDPNDGPYLFLELNEDVSTLMHRKYAVFKVNLKSYISHE